MTERHKHISGISLILVSILLLYSVIVGENCHIEASREAHAEIGIIGCIIINFIVYLLGTFGSVILFCAIFNFGLNLLIENRIFRFPNLILIASFLISITIGIITNIKGTEYSSGIVGKHVGNLLLSLFGLAGSAVFLGVIIFSLILNYNSLFIPKIRSYIIAFKNKHVGNSTLHLNKNSINDNQQSEYIEGEWSEV